MKNGPSPGRVVTAGQRLHVGFDEELRRMARQVHRLAQQGVARDAGEQVLGRAGADDGEHIGPLVLGMREIAHLGPQVISWA